ncbi:HD domain-containing protein [Streptomyces sp. NPDC059063]|uniref:HD domain-containing protein n=1 Tax=unclassified Streptomyces TaxID=2593676 RepID=UPI0036BAD075
MTTHQNDLDGASTAAGALDAYDGLPFPDSEVALAALRFARSTEHPAVFHHSLRAYLYGRLIGERDGLLPDRDYDDELLYLGCVLHDIGLTAEGDREQRFEVDGADLAAEFLTARGQSAERVEVVWDAIALHTSEGIASRKRPEIALMSAGTRLDIAGSPADLPPGYADRVHAVLPRLHAAAVLRDAIVDQARDKPAKAPLFSLPGELLRQRTGATPPTWEQLTPGWHDYDGYEGS